MWYGKRNVFLSMFLITDVEKGTEVNCKTWRKGCDKRNCEQNGFPVKDFESMVENVWYKRVKQEQKRWIRYEDKGAVDEQTQ